MRQRETYEPETPVSAASLGKPYACRPPASTADCRGGGWGDRRLKVPRQGRPPDGGRYIIVADGQRGAKHLRRARQIPQARLTVDLGAPVAVPLRGKFKGEGARLTAAAT